MKKKLREILKQWGFGEIEADIFATLTTRDGLTASEIAKEVGCAYSTTINSLNTLRRMGYVERARKDRKFVYFANIDFVKIMDEEMSRISRLLKELHSEIDGLRGVYREKMKGLAAKVERAIKYIEGKAEAEKEGIE